MRLNVPIVAIGLAIVLTFAALAPIQSYDFFWHLATGRWIAEHHALPLSDPFAIGSDRTPWINGEWLFELALHAVHTCTGFVGVAWTRAAFVALLFALAFWWSSRRGNDAVALLLTALAFAGAYQHLDARPSTAAALLLVIAVWLLTPSGGPERSVDGDRVPWLAYAIVTAVWINVHPSALLAPALAVITMLSDRRRWRMAAASAIALLANPYGWRAVAAPIELTAFARSGTFVNAEWLPSPPRLFPTLYLAIVVAVTLFALAENKRAQLWRLVMLAMFALLAVQHVRNQGLFFAALPLLVTPFAPAWLTSRSAATALRIVGVAIIAITFLRSEHRGGIAPHRFPIESVARLQASGLRGNIYNPDQLGGYLIWAFYPERRTLTDGRNELYHAYIDEYAKARLDSRAWHALLQRHHIDLAVDEYRGPLDVIDGMTGRHRALPASLAYWPRRDWALIAYDDVSMVFARRAAFASADLQALEIRDVVPDAQK